MGDTEVQTTAAREHGIADRAIGSKGIRMVGGMTLGEGDAHLHGSAGAYRIGIGKQLTPQRHATNQVFVDFAELALAAHAGNAIRVAAPIGRLQLERNAHGKGRDVVLGGAMLDFLACDSSQVGHHRIGHECRFLGNDGQCRTQVFRARRNIQQQKRGLDIGSPTRAIRRFGRDQLNQLGTNLIRCAQR
ncbi:MAG: hypothetical protein BWZ07_03129 [Alphaproteobacteria bacterium ADurb.BinA280]|nr:MAG: hypothetical protein BWZ07_03129 [Alphaproteobacteria bacterium ADurb.BinA280]